MLEVIDLRKGYAIRSGRPHEMSVSAIAVAPLGSTYASGSRDGRILLWRPGRRRGPQLLTADHAGSVSGLAFTPDGTLLVSAEGPRYKRQFGGIEAELGSSEGRVRVWDARSGDLLHTFDGHTADVHALSIVLGGRQAVTVCKDDSLHRFDLVSLEPLGPLPGLGSPMDAAPLRKWASRRAPVPETGRADVR